MNSALRQSYGLDGFEWSCPDCEKLQDEKNDMNEFVDLALRKLCNKEFTPQSLWLIEEIYYKMGYIMPKEIIENFA